MSDQVLKVQPWSEDQGDYVVIDADKFDESVHGLFDESVRKVYVGKEPSAKDKKSTVDSKNSQ